MRKFLTKLAYTGIKKGLDMAQKKLEELTKEKLLWQLNQLEHLREDSVELDWHVYVKGRNLTDTELTVRLVYVLNAEKDGLKTGDTKKVLTPYGMYADDLLDF